MTVDFSKYANAQLCQMSTFYAIVALSGRKGRIKNGKYYIDEQEIECDISSYIYVDEIKVDDKINLELTINIPYFQENDVNINCNYIVNGEKKSMKIKQVPFSKYIDRFRKKVFIELPKETTKITFSAKGIDKFEIKEYENIIIDLSTNTKKLEQMSRQARYTAENHSLKYFALNILSVYHTK